MNFLYLLFSFRGRINRAQYWLGNLIAGVGGGVLIFAITLATTTSAVAAKKPPDMLASLGSFMLALLPILLVMIWCGFAIQVKRLHDRGRSGWLALLPLGVGAMITFSIIMGIATSASGAALAASVQPFVWLSWAVNLAFLIDLGCLGSQPGPNKHGDPPGGAISRPPPTSGPTKAEASALLSAQAAMEAAIAAKDSVRLTPTNTRTAALAASPLRTSPSPSPVRTAPAPAPAAPATPSFGRRRTT